MGSLIKPRLSLFVFVVVVVFVFIVLSDDVDEDTLIVWSFVCVEDNNADDVFIKLGNKTSRLYPYADRRNGRI